MRMLLGCLATAGILLLATQKAGDADRGKAVYELYCANCHHAASAEKKLGPGLKGLFKKRRMQNGQKPTEQNVQAKIDKGGGGMPSYKDLLSDQEKADLMAYLKTL